MPPETFTGLTLARILRPHGLRGEVAAQILTDFPERLLKLREVWLADGRTPPRRTEITRCRLTPSRGGQAIFQFLGIESIEAAERLRGCEVQVPLTARAPLRADRYYVDDLAGCAVWEHDAPSALGTVGDVEFPGGVPLLVVEMVGGGEILVPLAADICVRIDVRAKHIEVRLPEGLRELNRA